MEHPLASEMKAKAVVISGVALNLDFDITNINVFSFIGVIQSGAVVECSGLTIK